MKIISIILITLGIILFLAGMLFKLLSWPDVFYGMYSGLALFLIGWMLRLPGKKK